MASKVIGLQWGDEGKGAVVDRLVPADGAVVRFQGGGNAGHTVVIGNNKYVLHYNPSGILKAGVRNYIGMGCVYDPIEHAKENAELAQQGTVVTPENLMIDERVHVIGTDARLLEIAGEIYNEQPVGSTLRAIGPTYSFKMDRKLALRLTDFRFPDKVKKIFEKRAEWIRHELDFYLGRLQHEDLRKPQHEKAFHDALTRLKLTDFYDGAGVNLDTLVERTLAATKEVMPLMGDVAIALNQEHGHGKEVLFEGAQGFFLDIDFGTFPYVTSSNASGLAHAAGSGLNVPTRTFAVTKAYTTRVGEGPFPTELLGEEGENLRKKGGEFGATTGRPRRCGWFDAFAGAYASTILRPDRIVVTKLDVLSGLKEIPICTGYELDGRQLKKGEFPQTVEELARVKPLYTHLPGWQADISQVRKESDLPDEAQQYLTVLSVQLGMRHIGAVSVGPEREQMIYCDKKMR